MSETHTLCAEHRSWFCPCVAPWVYAGKPEKARAWFEEDEDEDALPEQAEEAA